MRRKPAAKAFAKRRAVYYGQQAATDGGLVGDDLTKNKFGRVVSREVSNQKRNVYEGSVLAKWNDAVKRARTTFPHKAKFVPCGGPTVQGKQLLEQVRAIRRMEGW